VVDRAIKKIRKGGRREGFEDLPQRDQNQTSGSLPIIKIKKKNIYVRI
jgi:hypothetical protein